MLQVARIALLNHTMPDGSTQLFYWPAIILAAAVFICVQFTPLKKWHPIVFIAISAVAGILFGS